MVRAVVVEQQYKIVRRRRGFCTHRAVVECFRRNTEQKYSRTLRNNTKQTERIPGKIAQKRIASTAKDGKVITATSEIESKKHHQASSSPSSSYQVSCVLISIIIWYYYIWYTQFYFNSPNLFFVGVKKANWLYVRYKFGNFRHRGCNSGVEWSLCMRQVAGSIPASSSYYFIHLFYSPLTSYILYFIRQLHKHLRNRWRWRTHAWSFSSCLSFGWNYSGRIFIPCFK